MDIVLTGAPDPALVEALRVRYRCAACRKDCSVPCRFTFAEFRAMEQVIRNEASGARPGAVQTVTVLNSGRHDHRRPEEAGGS